MANVIKSGRAWNGAHRDSGTIVHIVDHEETAGFWGGKALCGTEPGYKGNGWYETKNEANCPKCLKRASAKLKDEAKALPIQHVSDTVCDRCADKPESECKNLCSDCWIDLHGM